MPPLAAAAPELRIEGLSSTPLVLRRGDLEALGPENVEWTQAGHDTYRAVPLDRVILRAGLDAGEGSADVAPATRSLGARRVVVATSSDGFTAVFSTAELLPDLGATRAYVAFAKNGLALPMDEVPLRLLVTSDKKGTRSLRQLVSLTVEGPRTGATPAAADGAR
jgi:hypothetical protein